MVSVEKRTLSGATDEEVPFDSARGQLTRHVGRALMPQRTLLATRDCRHPRDWIDASAKRQPANALWSLSARAALIALAFAAIVGVLSNNEPSSSGGLPAASAIPTIKNSEPTSGSTAINRINPLP
jgi:hypothetical protein